MKGGHGSPREARPGWGIGGTTRALVVLTVACGGCPPRPVPPPPFDPLPERFAARIVNDNLMKITAPLNARGRVRGVVTTDDGTRRSFDLAAHLFFLRPRYLRLDLKDALAGSQFLFGSNQTYYWSHNKPDGDTYWCKRYDRLTGDHDPDVPLSPYELIEALGLTPIPGFGGGASGPPIQRIVEEYQQFLFIERAEDGRTVLRKEYWLDRRAPRLVRRILFRDPLGRVTLESRLGAYRRLDPGGPWLPMRIDVSWPLEGAHMAFRIDRWRAVDQVRPDGPQFTPPHLRGVHYTREEIDDPPARVGDAP